MVGVNPSAQAAFDDLVARYAGRSGITTATAIASPGIRVDGHIFAMLQAGALVLKLPADRCRELIEGGRGMAFTSGGRAMREWVRLRDADSDSAADRSDWNALADEALAFVR